MSPREAGLWSVRDARAGHDRLKALAPEEVGLSILNYDEILQAEYRARQAHEEQHGEWPSGNIRMPDDMVRPRLMMPPIDLAPDYLVVTGLEILVSARLRYAMALPDPCVQYRPIELIDGSDLAYAQDYRWMSYLATEHVVDMERSSFELQEPDPDLPARNHPRFEHIETFVVREDFEPQAGLFRMYGYASTIVATEALIRRVERAECTDIQFLDLESWFRPRPQFIAREPTFRS